MWLVGRAFLVGSQNEPASRTFRKLREINPRAYGSRHSTRNPRPMSARDDDFMVRPGRPRDGASQGRQAKSFVGQRSEEHTSELQSLMRISYAVFCLKTKKYQISNKKTP